jgi:hypothetical protein
MEKKELVPKEVLDFPSKHMGEDIHLRFVP